LLLLILRPAFAATTLVAQPASPAGTKVLDPSDLAFWKSIRSAVTSNDGKWFAYQLVPNEGDGEVVIRPTAAGGKELRFPIGEPVTVPFNPLAPPQRSPALVVSGDAKWVAFTTYPTAEQAKPLQHGVTLIDLSSGQKRDFEKVRRFDFAGEKPGWLVMQRYPAEGATASDLVLLDLRSGAVSTIGAVADYGVDESGTWLAWTTEARDLVGNGVQLRNLTTGQVRPLDSEKAVYRQLAWADSGPSLAVLRGTPDSAKGDTTFALVALASADGSSPKVVYEPRAEDGFPADLRISPSRAPRWTQDLSALLFGLTARRTAPESKTGRPDLKPVAGTPGAMQTPAGVGGGGDDLPTLVIWHGRDPRLQAQQQVEESRDKSFSHLALYRVAEQKFLRLASDELREVQLTPRDRFAFGSDRRGYERRDNIDGGQRRDYYAVDLRTGARSLIKREARYPFFPSPDGTRALYYHDGQYHVYDFATGHSRSITAGAPTSFVNVEDDHNVDRPPVPPVGWSADSRFVLLSDRWDVWRVGAVGAPSFVNLTGNGQHDRIRYNRRVVVDPKEKGIDLTRPLYFQTYGEWTKKEGLARIAPNRPGGESLLWDDAKYVVSRARDAEVWVYSRQTFRQFPDYWAASGGFGSPTRLTDANPQQAEYAWSAGARLIDYVSDQGDSLQASLYLPAGYEPGKKYPTVVYIYEKLSQTLHSYAVPNETRAFNPSVYTSRGYAVLQPDIVYRVNDPGMSAVWCVVPAVKAAIATGIVDPAKVGLHGHSWGGYQSAFLSTQTGKLFSGIVSGAPLTDMISMYLSVYWNTGTADMAIFESSQGRFKGSYLDNHDAYVRNSPAFFVNQVETPIMILHNEKDGAVDFNQGITFFNSLREQEKDVIMLQYVGENHGLQQPQNQKDYTIRMQEYFDHYLRGMPAPEWMKEGIPRLDMEKHLKARQKKPKAIS
jgi:dienelactone hydrolase